MPKLKTPKVDVRVSGIGGSIISVTPLTPAARTWIKDYVVGDTTWWGGALMVEPRYLDPLVGGMRADGLVVA